MARRSHDHPAASVERRSVRTWRALASRSVERRSARTWRALASRALAGLAGLWIASASTPASASEPAGDHEGFHRGVGWYDADARIPEPPLALALVIIGAWAMRRRDRRRRLA